MDTEKEKNSERKKRVQWTPDAVRFLLQVWRNSLRDLESTKRTRHIYERMSELMIDRGFNFSAKEVNVKMHNLKNKYQEERKQIECGATPEGEWRFYGAIDYLMGNRRGYEWKELMVECADPLYDYNEELAASHENRRFKDAVLSDYEENVGQDDSKAADTNLISICSSEEDLNDGQSESEILQNSKASAPKQEYIKTKRKIVENDGFRIIADGVLPRKRPYNFVKETPLRNGNFPKETQKTYLYKSETDKHNAQYLNLAKLELIKLQTDQIKQEMHYRSQEFEQKTREHKLRLRYMQEEHELRMISLQNDLKSNSKVHSQESD